MIKRSDFMKNNEFIVEEVSGNFLKEYCFTKGAFQHKNFSATEM